MRLSIDTDVDTFESALAAVHAAYGQPAPTVAPSEPTGTAEEGPDDDVDQDDYLPGRWTDRKLRRLVDWLADSDAAAALRFIADQAPSVAMDDVFTHMAKHTGINDFAGQQMGGRMSAVGFALNNIGNVGAVYETDYNKRRYRMDPRLAKALLRVMDSQAP